MKTSLFASHFSALPISGCNLVSWNVCIVSPRGYTGALACHQNREKALVYQRTTKPKKLSESKWMCVCVCFCQGELLLFYPWLWSCNRSGCPFSFIWLTAEPTLAETFFSFLTFPFPFFLNFIFLSSSPEIHHSSMQLPSVIFDLFGSVCLNQREGAETILTDVKPYNDFLQ